MGFFSIVSKIRVVKTIFKAESVKITTPKTFKNLGIREDLLKSISFIGYKKPSKIQEESIKLLLENGPSCQITSHTGSGKTLAYLLPIMQNLKNDEEKINQLSYPKKPRAIILAPTRELTEQIYDVAKSISAFTKLRLS